MGGSDSAHGREVRRTLDAQTQTFNHELWQLRDAVAWVEARKLKVQALQASLARLSHAVSEGGVVVGGGGGGGGGGRSRSGSGGGGGSAGELQAMLSAMQAARQALVSDCAVRACGAFLTGPEGADAAAAAAALTAGSGHASPGGRAGFGATHFGGSGGHGGGGGGGSTVNMGGSNPNSGSGGRGGGGVPPCVLPVAADDGELQERGRGGHKAFHIQDMSPIHFAAGS